MSRWARLWPSSPALTQSQGESTVLNMKLNADGMPVDDLQTMLPALGIVLPSGSSLQGGTLSVNVGIVGPVDKLVITGPIRLAQTKLAGFNLASKMSAISALSGAQTGSDTSIQNLSTDARVAPEGVRTQNINLTIPALGTVTGNGTISPGGAFDYKMNASLSGGAVTGLTQLAGIGGKGGGIPFFIQGTTSDPKFVPDVKGMVGSQIERRPGRRAGRTDRRKESLGKLSGGRAGRAVRGKRRKSSRGETAAGFGFLVLSAARLVCLHFCGGSFLPDWLLIGSVLLFGGGGGAPPRQPPGRRRLRNRQERTSGLRIREFSESHNETISTSGDLRQQTESQTVHNGQQGHHQIG